MKHTLLAVAGLSIALSMPAFAQQAGGTQKLYDRLGGMRGIAMVVDDFIGRLVVNQTLNRNPAINAGRESSPAPYLKFQVATLLCEVTGGPCEYVGRALKDSHAHLNITEREWNVMVGEFKKSLAKFKVPEAEQKELFDIVGTTKADIVLKK